MEILLKMFYLFFGEILEIFKSTDGRLDIFMLG